MRPRLSWVLLATALWLPSLSFALSLGGYQLNSYLNQPLNMDIELSGVDGLDISDIVVGLASDEEFARAGIRKSGDLTSLNFDVALKGNGEGSVHISSDEAINQPYVDLLVKAQSPAASVTREYTVLLDPASYNTSDEGADSQQANVIAAPKTTQPSVEETISTPTKTAPTKPSAKAEPEANTKPTADPKPAAAKPAATTKSSSPAEYQVKSGDTLWEIARDQRQQSDVSIQQMIVAIQRANPDAFYVKGNSNFVKAGAVLSIPGHNQVQQQSMRTAMQQLAKQNQQWQKISRQQQKKSEQADTQTQRIESSSNEVDRRTDEQQADHGEVKLLTASNDSSATEDDQDSESSDATSDQAALAKENIDRLKQENEELSSRIDDLKAQIATSDQLLAARDRQIKAMTAKLNALQQAANDTLDQSSEKNSEQSSDKNSDNAAQPAPTTAEQPSLLTKMWQSIQEHLMWLGAGLLILLLLLWLFIRRRQQNDDELSPIDDDIDENAYDDEAADDTSDGIDATVTAAAEATESVTDNRDGEQQLSEAEQDAEMVAAEDNSGDQQLTPGADDDTVSAGTSMREINKELEVLMAYGRFPQAIELLRDALAKDSDNADLKVRLLELEKEAGDDDAFELDAARLAGTDPLVDECIQRLGGRLDTASPAAQLDTIDADDNLADFDLATATASPEESDATDPALASYDLNDTKDEAADIDPEDDGTVDFDFDFDDVLADTTTADNQNDGELTEALTSDDDALDFDLDFMDQEETADTDKTQTSTDEAEDSFNKSEVDTNADEVEWSLDDLEQEFSENDNDVTTADLDSTLEKAEDNPGLTADWDADLTITDEPDLTSFDDMMASEPEPEPEPEPESEPGLEPKSESELEPGLEAEPDTALGADVAAISAIDNTVDSLGEATTEASVTDSAETTESAADDDDIFDLDLDDDFDFPSDMDENATRLDLARAYIDMGDSDGASDLLNEVLDEGDEQQKSEAQELLSRM